MGSNQILIEFSVVGQDDYGHGVLNRNLAPRTCALIHYQLRKPIQTRIVVRQGEISFPFKIGRASPENAKKDVHRGDIGYWTQSNVLVVYLQDKNLDYPSNIIGHIQDPNDLVFFDSLKIGRSIKLEKIQQPIDEDDFI